MKALWRLYLDSLSSWFSHKWHKQRIFKPQTLKQDGGGNKKAANAGDADFPKWGRVQQVLSLLVLLVKKYKYWRKRQIFDNRLAEKAAQEREREREQKEAKKAFVQYVPVSHSLGL